MEIISLVKYEKYLISKRKLIKHALQVLNKYDFKTLFVVNNLAEKKLIGTITDGDIRRALINGFQISDKVEKICFKDCFSIKKISKISEHIKKINEYSIRLVPKVDNNNKILDIYQIKNHYADDWNGTNKKNISILLMAGGKGSRLGNLTKKTPKSILIIKKISIIDRIINQIIDQGYDEIYVSINYLANKIKKHLLKYKNTIKIKFIEEKKPLGTIGSLKYIDTSINRPVIVIYTDIVTNFDLDKITNFHFISKSKLTIVGKKHILKNPYGVLKINKNNKLLNIDEKPTIESFISTGIFVINAELKIFIKHNVRTEMDRFINKMLKKKFKISVFNNNDYWYDLGNKQKLQNFKSLLDDK
jgi:dTDP-glucose pyrophosphorylase